MQEVTFGSKIELQVSVTRTSWKNCPSLAKLWPNWERLLLKMLPNALEITQTETFCPM